MNHGVLLRELLQSWRASLRRPGFVLLAGLTLALGVGASVAGFALLYSVMLKPLPYPDPSRLVQIGPSYAAGVSGDMSPIWYQHLGKPPGLASVGAAHGGRYVNVAGSGQPVMVAAQSVDRGFLATLGVAMALGRNFTRSEDSPHAPPAVILSHGFWLRQFDGSDAVIGRTLMVDGQPHAVVGVLPTSFRWSAQVDLLLPLQLAPHSTDPGTNLTIIGRLAPNTTLGTVSAQIQTRMQNYARASGDPRALRAHFAATALAANLDYGYRSLLWMVLACAGCVLLIAGGNVSNLMLLRAAAQSHPSSVRAALGAHGLRLVLPALAETLLVAMTGVALGLLVAAAGIHWLNSELMHQDWFGTVRHIGLNARLLAFALIAALLVAGLAALLRIWRVRASAAPQELMSGGRGGLSVSAGRLSRVLVIAQAALAASLVLIAALFAHSLLKLTRVDLGFDPTHVLTFAVAPPRRDYPNDAALSRLSGELLHRLREIPGVQRVALTSNPPIQSALNLPIQLPSGQEISAQYRFVSPDLFATLGIPLLRGRGISVDDRRGTAPVAVVSAAFQRRHLSGNALGQILTINLSEIGVPIEHLTVTGIAGDIRQFGPQQPAPAIVYVPIEQVPSALMAKLRQFVPLYFMLRVHGNPRSYESTMRAAVHEIAPGLALATMQPLGDRVAAALAPTRLLMLLAAIVAALALGLASVGLYSVMAVATAARRREFGVRAAMGATPQGLMMAVLRTGLLQVCGGLVLGLGIAWAVSGVLRAYLFGLHVLDPLAVLTTCAMLLLAGSLACIGPALRAARTPPTASLNESAD
ncbi:ADOP family duplicated permease [Metallibacterium sp.]|uniref:ADOP family duplicated permease n=1 Tax=Metallibacterium sp. TaxID=2940281 RepID=UPI00262CF128|nr:ADOP family duplicated permease [Metallibacterium sp.]